MGLHCGRLIAVAVLAYLAFSSFRIAAVPFADRTIAPDPLDRPIVGEGGFASDASGWGEFSRFVGSSDNDHTWDAKMGAYEELYRSRNLWSVAVASDLELIANPDNDIDFFPRVFYWQESLFYMRRADWFDWGLGYYHRCRHDIDNLSQYIVEGIELERVCIYDSITLRLLSRPVLWAWDSGGLDRASLRMTVDEHYYVIRQDATLVPEADRGLLLTDLTDSLVVGLLAQPFRRNNFSWYLTGKECTDLYLPGGAPVVSADVLAETGLQWHGASASIALFFRYEHFAETLEEPRRQPGDYVTIGLQVE